MDVLVIGAGGHGQVVADALLRASGENRPRPMGFLDDQADLLGERFLGLPVLGPVPAFREYPEVSLVVAVGDNATRAALTKRLLRYEREFQSVIHPSAVIAPDVQIGPGAMICAGVVVNPGAQVGESAILNTGCTVDHHCEIGAYAHVAPGVNLGGNVQVGEGALVSIGAAVVPGRRLGQWSVVGAGSVVLRDVPERTTVVGKPARPIGQTARGSA